MTTDLQLLRDGKPLPSLDRPDPVDIVREEAARPFRLDALSGPEMQRVMTSVEQMAQAQLHRFKAAGIVAIIFDETGMSCMSLVRPDDRPGITDDHVCGALQSIVDGVVGKPSGKRSKR